MRSYSYNGLDEVCNRNAGNTTCPSSSNASYFWNDVSTKCVECSTNCTSCDYENDNCTSCQTNYTLVTNETSPGLPWRYTC